MNEPQIMFLEPALKAARFSEDQKNQMRVVLPDLFGKLAFALELKATERLFCFASPHIAGLLAQEKHPHAWKFVIPDEKYVYDKGWLKVAFWIMDIDRLVADAKHGTHFIGGDGHAQIADDSFIRPEQFVDEMRAHLRDGKIMDALYDQPRNIVEEQIFPLLKIPVVA
jgi:hypothetical protein